MRKTMRDIDIRISGKNWPLNDTAALAMVQQVLNAAETHIGPFREGTLEVWFAADADLQELNKKFRGKNTPTNVLSFMAPASPSAHFAPSFGQLALADGVCTIEAKVGDITLTDHTRHLVLHGLLHLQGYDHEAEEEAQKMEKLERTIMKNLGLHDPYPASGALHA